MLSGWSGGQASGGEVVGVAGNSFSGVKVGSGVTVTTGWDVTVDVGFCGEGVVATTAVSITILCSNSDLVGTAVGTQAASKTITQMRKSVLLVMNVV